MKENQKITIWWIYFILLSIIAYLLYDVYSLNKASIRLDKSLITLIIPISLLIMFLLIKLETKIENEIVRYRLFPFHLKFRELNRNQIQSISFVEFNPIKDHGGWGIRMLKNGWAFTLGGKKGIKISLKTGENIILGSKLDQEKIESVVKNWKNVVV